MKLAGLKHDEGPDIGGDFGPYVQSERKDMYLPYAEQLIKRERLTVVSAQRKDLKSYRTALAVVMTDIAVIFRRKKSTDFLPRVHLM